MWNQFKKLFLASFKTTFREKQVWFWSIFFPVLLLIIFLTIFSGSGSSDFKTKIAVVMDNENEISTPLLQALHQIPVFEWYEDDPVARDQAEQWVKDKKVDAVIVLPDSADSKQVDLLLNSEKQNSTTEQALTGILNGVLQQTNYVLAGVEPQLLLSTDYLSAQKNLPHYTDFLVTGLIALAVGQSGLFGMVSLVEMRRNGLLKRLKLTPASIKLFGLSDMMVRLLLAIVQVILLVAIGVLLYGARFDVNLPTLAVIFIVGTSSFTAFGFMIASLSKSMESYMGIANLASFIMMFLSGVFFDYSALPSYIKPIADVLPLTYFVNGIRDSMIYSTNLLSSTIWLDIGIMLLWGAVTFLIGSKFYSWKAEAK